MPLTTTADTSFSSPAPEALQRYDSLTIVLHWLTAALVFALFGLGETWDLVPHPTHHVMVVAHMTAGLTLVAVLALRIGWRLTKGRRFASSGSVMATRMAHCMAYTLYALLVAEACLGFAWRWGAGRAMSFFALQIGSPFAAASHDSVVLFRQLHNWTAWLIIGLALVHGIAAICHAVILRDGVLERMRPARPNR
ncbi:MAG: cytochrome b/b6 domain-containing protein [Acetobacter sp.]|uniref:cytochrome b n=1 Tax=Acetobacter sp. TaxID=440 RepID=UPI0039E7F871